MDGTTDQLYFDTWINNYHFITLNTEKDLKDNAYLSNEQLNWLKDVIKEGAHKDKPIFIQIHQTFTNTADHESLDLIGEQEEALKEILKDCDLAAFYDNTERFRRFAIFRNGEVVRISHNLPKWIEEKEII